MRFRRGVAAAAAVLALAALASCGGDNELSGSVSELFPLQVSRVEVFRNAEALQVSYLNNRGSDLDVVVRVTVALEGYDLQPGTRVPLTGEYAPGHQRVSVAHAPGGEPVRVFPPVTKGDLTLTAGGQGGEPTRGTFSMVFAADAGGDLGAGRNLSGSFSAIARDAGFDPLP